MIRKYLSDDHARLDAALQAGDYESFREGLHVDHGALAALLVPTPTPAILDAIRTILENHNPLEEGPGGLYEECERRLGAGVSEALKLIQNAPPAPVARHVDNQISMQSLRNALRRARDKEI